MTTRITIIVATATGITAVAGAIGGVGAATTGGHDERPITGDALERASQVALDHVGALALPT